MLGMEDFRMARIAVHGGGRGVGAEAKFGVRRLAAALLRPGLPGRAPLARKSGRGKPRSAEASGPQKARPMKARASSRTPHEAKKRLMETHANSEIRVSHSGQKTSHFLIETINATFRNPASPRPNSS